MNNLRKIKHLWWAAVLLLCVPSAWGFALLGPLANGGDSWQTTVIGYGLLYEELIVDGGPVQLGDVGGPKNIGEAYRRNSPVIFYACDASFLDYFGSNGVVAVDNAASIINRSMTNNSLGNLDGYSDSLTEFPLVAIHPNLEAESMYLTDLKSVTLHLLVEQMGLAEPERFTWTLAERFLPAGTCPLDEEYLILQRNYADGPTPLNQIQYSSDVNGVSYTYELIENCAGPNPLAYTVPYAVGSTPLGGLVPSTYTAVAANDFTGLGIGNYYSSLTRDDVGGLRYLLTSNNIVWETPAFAGTTASSGAEPADLLTTNLGPQTTITTSNLYTLLTFSQTNDPGVTATTFGVTVTGTNYSWTYVTNWNYFLTTPYGKPIGTQVLSSNIASVSLVPTFTDTFGNVITNGNLTNFPINFQCTNIVLNYSSNTPANLITVSFVTQNGQPANSGSPTTNIQPITLNTPSGEYFTLPTGSSNECGWEFVCEPKGPGYNIISTTNVIGTATNTTTGFVGSQSIVTVFTNHTYVVEPILCTQTPFATSLYEGVEKVLLTNADFDSLVGQYFQPITNYYSMTMVTNSQAYVETFERIVTTPDILFDASDQIAANTFDGSATRSITFDQDNIQAGLAGPGTINPLSTISFNKVGDAFENYVEITDLGTNGFQYTQTPVLQWASFDSSTNDPVLYPNGTSIQNLQSQILVQVTPAPPGLPNGTTGVSYGPYTFSATGGAFTSSVSWKVLTALGSLPPGLSLTSGGVLSGTPTQSGTYDFTVQMTDSLGRSVNWNYTIVIN